MPTAKLTQKILKNIVEKEKITGIIQLEEYIKSTFSGEIIFETWDTFCLNPIIEFHSDKYMTMFLLNFGEDDNV